MDQRGRDQAPPIDINTEATTRSNQKRQEQREADLKRALEFRNHESRHQDTQREVLRFCRLGLICTTARPRCV